MSVIRPNLVDRTTNRTSALGITTLDEILDLDRAGSNILELNRHTGGRTRSNGQRVIADNQRRGTAAAKCTIAANNSVQKVGENVQKKNGLRTIVRRSSFIAANL